MGSSGLNWDHDWIMRGCRLGDPAKYFDTWTFWSFAASHQKGIYRLMLFADDNPFLFVHRLFSKQKETYDTTESYSNLNGIIRGIIK